MDSSRLQDPGDLTVLSKIRKDLAQSSRGLQTSLAVSDLAKHLGGPSKIDTLTKTDLKGLSQVMGTLAQESALAQLPRFESLVEMYKAQKTKLREKVLAGISPPSVELTLRKAPIFSESLFPEKIFREVDVKARDSDLTNYFPKMQKHHQGAVKRPLPLQQRGTEAPLRKKGRAVPVPNPVSPTGPRAQIPTNFSTYNKETKLKRTFRANNAFRATGSHSAAGPSKGKADVPGSNPSASKDASKGNSKWQVNTGQGNQQKPKPKAAGTGSTGGNSNQKSKK